MAWFSKKAPPPTPPQFPSGQPSVYNWQAVQAAQIQGRLEGQQRVTNGMPQDQYLAQLQRQGQAAGAQVLPDWLKAMGNG